MTDYKHIYRHKHDRQGLILGMIGVIGLMLLIYSVSGTEQQTMAERGWCITCHMPNEPKIKTLAQYKVAHPSPAELRKRDKRLLAELVR